MAEVNHICIICGSNYLACDSCDKVNSWRAICDTPLHYQVYMLFKEYKTGRITKEEAKNSLSCLGIGLSEISDYKDSVKDVLKGILTSESVSIVIDYNTQEEVNETNIENNVVEHKRNQRKKNSLYKYKND